ncbi:biosynthetic peptidoglycan transglycosylase [Clostridium sp.]|uniref:biosynthetic peptidoglycan transglycosylase n=1 Tax=Clostridium sp. TaxID=1506 RepID=UPI00261E3678|nr:biosynthetic peptidoglycan transglycosylase [Clostridium sp.]
MKPIIGKRINVFLIIITTILFSTFFVGCSIFKKDYRQDILNEKVEVLRENPNYVKIEDVNKEFLDAVVATEDNRFYNHGALDFKGIARAIVNDIKALELREGGSTITQQTAKNLCLSNERSLSRKIKEIFLSFQLEREYSKEEILELYVNSIYFGSGYTGIKEASNGYFNRSPKNLTYNEATLLAGLPQAPSRYDLKTKSGLKLAKERQKFVEKALNEYKENNN